MKTLATEAGVFFAALFVSAGLLFGGERLSRPDSDAPALRLRVEKLERDNRALRVQIDAMRREAIRPTAPTGDNIPTTSLPTEPTK